MSKQSRAKSRRHKNGRIKEAAAAAEQKYTGARWPHSYIIRQPAYYQGKGYAK